jgi:hypothetical protein
MKKILLFIAILSTISCTNENSQVKDRTLIYSCQSYDVYKIKIDSVEYLVAKGYECISIIKK